MSGSLFDWAFRAVVLSALLGIGVVLHQSRGLGADQAAMRQLAERVESLERSIEKRGTDSYDLPPGAAVARTSDPRQSGSLAGVKQMAAAQQSEAYDEGRRRELQRLFAAEATKSGPDSVPQQVIAAFGSDAVVQAVDIPQSQNVNCRAGMCLIRATFKPGEDSSDWATRMMLELAPALSSYSTAYTRLPDGGHEVSIYAARNHK